jgi:threonine/homoserine/homoserine lactone efflux protein
MDWNIVIAGIVIGVFIAAPVGPVNLICIRRTLARGTQAGFMPGLGAALGDGVFAAITGFGLTAASAWLEAYAFWLQLIGGIFLVGLGVHTFFSRAKDVPMPSTGDHAGIVVSTFLLTITNPATLLAFAALVGGVGGIVIEGANYAAAATLVGSVFLGSAFWWIALSLGVGLLHGKLGERQLTLINHISGAIIGIAGLVVLARLL